MLNSFILYSIVICPHSLVRMWWILVVLFVSPMFCDRLSTETSQLATFFSTSTRWWPKSRISAWLGTCRPLHTGSTSNVVTWVFSIKEARISLITIKSCSHERRKRRHKDIHTSDARDASEASKDGTRARLFLFFACVLNPAYGVYISQLVRYARICSRKDDFIYRHRRLSLKLQQQGYKYQQLMKSFHKFYRSHSDELKKFGTTLMELRSSIWKEVLVEYILLNYIWTYFWCVRGCVFIFFHCFMCYLLRVRFPIFCSHVPVSLWCIFSWRWTHTLY